jgi:hypothetical protein
MAIPNMGLLNVTVRGVVVATPVIPGAGVRLVTVGGVASTVNVQRASLLMVLTSLTPPAPLYCDGVGARACQRRARASCCARAGVVGTVAGTAALLGSTSVTVAALSVVAVIAH